MKKIIATMVSAVVISASAFALDFSIGAGFTGITGTTVGTVTLKEEERLPDYLADKLDFKSKEMKSTSVSDALAGYVFFDATYVEVDISLGGGNRFVPGPDDEGVGFGRVSTFNLGLGLLGKYPIAIGSSGFTVAPLLGIQYDIVLGATTDQGNAVKAGDKNKGTGLLGVNDKEEWVEYKVGDLSALTIKFGVGGSLPITEKLSFTAQYLWGIRLNSKYEADQVDAFNKAYDDYGAEIKLFNSSSTFKLAVAYKL